MPKSSLSLADIANAYIEGDGTSETLVALRNLTLRTEVMRTILEQASADPNAVPANMRDVVKTILTPWQTEEESTTGTAAEMTRTLLDIFGSNNFTSVVVSSYQFPVLLDWLQYRGSWFAVESEPSRRYRVVVRIVHKEALEKFARDVLANYFD